MEHPSKKHSNELLVSNNTNVTPQNWQEYFDTVIVYAEHELEVGRCTNIGEAISQSCIFVAELQQDQGDQCGPVTIDEQIGYNE